MHNTVAATQNLSTVMNIAQSALNYISIYSVKFYEPRVGGV